MTTKRNGLKIHKKLIRWFKDGPIRNFWETIWKNDTSLLCIKSFVSIIGTSKKDNSDLSIYYFTFKLYIRSKWQQFRLWDFFTLIKNLSKFGNFLLLFFNHRWHSPSNLSKKNMQQKVILILSCWLDRIQTIQNGH